MQIVAIQILRAVAALSVAIGHGQHFIEAPMEKLGEVFPWSYLLPWGAGVDLFFVISGFIMVHSSEKLFEKPGGARVFMWRRLSRIVPLYWAAMALSVARNYVQHKPPEPDTLSVLTSIFFIPWDTRGTGVPRPLYELGWTLNYEMFFYAVFALAIGFAREKAVALVAGALSALIVLGLCFPQSNPQLFVWTQPITLEFAFGMGLALLARRGVALAPAWRAGLMLTGAALFVYDALDTRAQSHVWLAPNDLLRVVGWGVPAAMLMSGAVLGPSPLRDNWATRAGAALGDASYALYLFHPAVMVALSGGWFWLGLDKQLSPWLAVWSAVALSSIVALYLHRWFEKPMTEYLQMKRRPADAKPSAMSAALRNFVAPRVGHPRTPAE